MICLSSVSRLAADRERHLSAAIVAARAVSAYVLGAILLGVTLYGGSEYLWEGGGDAQVMELEAVIQAVVSEVCRLAKAAAFGAGGDVYRPIENGTCGPARAILARADVQRALNALTMALLIHGLLTGDEAAEIILTAFVAD